MKLTDYLVTELDREVERSRWVLKAIPEGNPGWKPHTKSMTFENLANLVAAIPTWIPMQITQDEVDLAFAYGSRLAHDRCETKADLIEALDKAAADARQAFGETTDEHLTTPWRLLVRGEVVLDAPRYEVIQDTINHWAHHRGQMTVYLRMMGARVPALYGPSADDDRFRRF